MKTVIIDKNFLTQVLVHLVSINSTNPSLSPEGAGEANIAAYVSDTCRSMGLDVESFEHAPGRVSVLGKITGTGGGKSLMLNAHLDTVGVTGMESPFHPVIKDGRLYGRGAQDMKGSLAACLAALHAIQSAQLTLKGDLLLAAVADEEFASLGSDAIARAVKVDGALVTEPTDLQLCTAHKGFAWIQVRTIGAAAHGSRYKDGIDANRMMGQVLAGLDTLDRELKTRPPHPLCGHASLHAAKISGGTEWSVYAAECTLQIERRLIPGETEQVALNEVQHILDNLVLENQGFRGECSLVFARPAFEALPDSELRPAIEQAYRVNLAATPTPVGISFWMDSAILAAAGADTLIIGPSGAGLHSATEWVDLESCCKLAQILVDTAVIYCGTMAA